MEMEVAVKEAIVPLGRGSFGWQTPQVIEGEVDKWVWKGDGGRFKCYL